MSVETVQRVEISAADIPRAAPEGRWPRLDRVSGLAGDRLAVDLYAAVEFFAILAIGILIAEYYVAGRLGVDDYFRDYAGPLLITPLAAVIILRRRGIYEFSRLCRSATAIGPAAAGIATAFALLIIAGFAAGIANDFSRVWFVSWFGTATTAILILRTIAAPMFVGLAAAGYIQKKIAIYGVPKLVNAVAAEIEQAQLGIELTGIFGPARKLQPGGEGAANGTLRDLIAFAQSSPVDTIILALPLTSARRLRNILLSLSILPAEVKLFPAIGDGRIPIHGVSTLDRLPLIDLQRKPISDWGLIVKTVEDYAVAVLGLVVLAPVFLMIAAAIKLDSRGPVFFVQRRNGFNQKVIRVWKFRTMRVMEDGDDFVQARRRDSRVTRVGAILRRTSLDELPQLFNVLRGEMSVVGPRPHPLALNSRFAKLLRPYESRHRVKPGITGWAQINGYRGPTEDPEQMRKRIELDIEYIENWSLWLDLRIIAITPFVGLVHRNAV